VRAARLEPEADLCLHWDVDEPWPQPPFTIDAVAWTARGTA
jgi:hypothetical protein